MAQALLLAWAVAPGAALAQGCANRIACENQQTGDTDWDIDGSGDQTIQGFATDISYKPGDTVNFKIKTDASNYTIAIYRMGYYGGAGARRITTVSPSASLPQTQPACLTDTNTNLLDCGNWNVSASWQIPSAAVSGLYFALLTRPDTGGESQIFFVVRDDAAHSDILYVTSDETWQAYNDYGGHSLYGTAGTFDLNNRAYKVSYNRPFDTRSFEAATFLFNAEYPMIRFLEANGYDVSYFTNIDEVRNASLLTNHKIIISSGHDEYVSGPRRANIEAARDAGVNLAFFSGNEVFWKTRWENSIDGSNTPYRTLVCYKETYYGTGQAVYKRDPNDPSTWTGTWRDPRFSPPADGGRPENALTGTLFMVNGPGNDNIDLSILVPAADGKMRFWRNTSVATQSAGQTATLPAGTLGYEWDGDVDNGARPAGLFPLTSSSYALTTDLLLDYGATYGAGNLTHHATLYRAPSGALVFGAGTVQWAWGLDNNHDNGGGNTADVRMQQATVNLFADMGVQPTTLQSGLVFATQSTDHTAPTAAITSPASGGTVAYGSAVTISGTAADAGGGVVGAVEVSTDGGQTWHPATGRETWSYQWYPYAQSGQATIMARAVDDSGNLQTTPAGASYNVSGEPNCPCSIWSSSATPSHPSENDPNPIEVGVKFRSDTAGSVTGVRFYKGTNNTGTHVGHLWSLQGNLLGTVTFTNETATGWQQANFSSPIAISANTTYIVSYYAPNGDYADDEPYFANQSIDNPPLHAPATGDAGGNGLYVYASGGGFPTATYNSGNYWVDVVFSPPSPWSISGTVSGAGAVTVALSGAATGSVTSDSSGNYTFANVANGSYTVTPSKNGYSFTPASQNVTVNGATVSGVNFTATALPTYTISGNTGLGGATVKLSGTETQTVTADASGNYSFSSVVNGSYVVTPSKAQYVFTPQSQNVTVNSANATAVNFTATVAASIWSDSAVPGSPAVSDPSSVELGVKFRSDVAGNVAGVRFYKGTTNTGTHIGNLWTSTGTKLATVTFSAETASGWQQALFASPVAISPNTTYIVSYYAPNGNYAADGSYFAATGADNPPLHALQNGVDGPNGVYLYATGGGFPSSTYNATNYWVDLVFVPAPGATISGTITNGSGATVSLSGAASASTTADSSGNYSFGGLANGSYTITPTKSGFSITPASQNVSVNNANVTGVNFTATANTYAISGTVTNGSGATITLSGAGNAMTTADGSGNYSFTNLANGTYTVTPSKSGFSITPASQNVTVNNGSVTGVNFTASAATGSFSISGTITNGSGSSVTMSGVTSGSTTVDSAGNYSFSNLPNGSYTVTPSKAGFSFAPASQSVTISGANVSGVNFTGKGITRDATVFKDQATASTTVTSPSFSTTGTNELLLAFISADRLSSVSNTKVSSIAGGGLTWALVKRTNGQNGTAEIWRAMATTPLANVTITATLNQSVQSSMTVMSFAGVDTSGTNGSGAIGVIGGSNAQSGAPSASLVTTRINSWVFGVGSDFDNAIARTPGTAQSLVHQYLATNTGDTYWVQMQNAPTPASGTTVKINDTAPTGDRYNLAICAVQPAP